jgi:hypothetical protein
LPHRQLLHLVIGGELIDVDAWRAKAQSTVDNAHMRYFIIHAHKLLNPDEDDDDAH